MRYNCAGCMSNMYAYIFLMAIFCLICSIIYTIIFSSHYPYGCYNDDNVDLCNSWNKKYVNITTYVDTTNVNIDCNCNICVNSDICDCDLVTCYLMGNYGNKECKIVYDYEFTNEHSSTVFDYESDFEDIWSYENIQTKKIGKKYEYYVHVNKFSGYCMPEHDVNYVGDLSYYWFIGMIVSWCSFACCIFYFCLMKSLKNVFFSEIFR